MAYFALQMIFRCATEGKK